VIDICWQFFLMTKTLLFPVILLWLNLLVHARHQHRLSVLPDKIARFLFEFHAFRFESLDLPVLPADRSDFDVHGALEDDKMKNSNLFVFFDI
jgi:hypothetical protein